MITLNCSKGFNIFQSMIIFLTEAQICISSGNLKTANLDFHTVKCSEA
jgi:hypothetical protein